MKGKRLIQLKIIINNIFNDSFEYYHICISYLRIFTNLEIVDNINYRAIL